MSEKEILLTAILKCQRVDLYSGKLALTKEQEERLAYCLSLRSKGIPCSMSWERASSSGSGLRWISGC